MNHADSSDRPSILIAGAGIGGLTCALACRHFGLSVTVVEQAAESGEVGAGLQLGPNAMHVLNALGLGSALAHIAFTPKRAVMRHFETGAPLLETGLNPAHQHRYGQPYLHVHRADLHALLEGAAVRAGAYLTFNRQATTFRSDEARVVLDCGSVEHEGDVLIGADGIHSVVRERLAGAAPARFTGQSAWRGLIDATRLPVGLLSPDAHVWLGPDKHFVAYYVRGGDLVNFVAVREQSEWAEESWHTAGNIEDVRAEYRNWDPVIDQLLSQCERCFQWGLFDRPELESWQNGRVALLGDACHPMLPFMAQGAAMAIEDAWVLAELLHRNRALPELALSEYQRIRKPRTAAVHRQSARNAATYHRANPVSVALRNASFAIANAAPMIANSVLDRIYGVNVTQNFGE